VGKGFRNKYWNRIELLKKWFGIEPEFEFIFYNEKNMYLQQKYVEKIMILK